MPEHISLLDWRGNLFLHLCFFLNSRHIRACHIQIRKVSRALYADRILNSSFHIHALHIRRAVVCVELAFPEPVIQEFHCIGKSLL